MIRVLGAVAAAYVGYSLGNVVKHQKDDGSPRPGQQIVPEQPACDDDVSRGSVGRVKASTEDALLLAYPEDLQNGVSTEHNESPHCNAGDGNLPSPDRAVEDRSRVADKLDDSYRSLAFEKGPIDLECRRHQRKDQSGGCKNQLQPGLTAPPENVEVFGTTASMDNLCGNGERLLGSAHQCLQTHAQVKTSALTLSNGEVPIGTDNVDTSSRESVQEPEARYEYDIMPETPIASERQGKLVLQDTPRGIDGDDLTNSVVQQEPQEVRQLSAEPKSGPEPSEQPDPELPKRKYYLDVFQQEWTHLLHEDRRERLLLVEANKRARLIKQIYLKSFEREWIQRLEEERKEQNSHLVTQKENIMLEEQRRKYALSLLQADNSKLQVQLADIVRAKEQQEALADGKIHDLGVMLLNLQAEIKMQNELLDQSRRKIQEVIEQEKITSEEKLKDLCLLLGKVELENLRLKDLVAETNGRMQDAIVQAEKVASAKLANLQLELEQVKADHTSQQRQFLELKTKVQAAEQEKDTMDSNLRESIRETENQRLAWEAQLQSRLAEERKAEQRKLQEQFRIQLEAHKLAQELAYQKKLDEDITNQKLELQTQWSEKIKTHKEEITSFLVEETKKKLIDEREKWRSAQEVEWKKRLDKEREQQLLLQEEKDKERKLADDRIRKEGARLELRLSSVSARERDMEQRKDTLQQKEREIDQKLLEVEVLQKKTNLREKLLRTVENDFFDEANFDRWISLRLGKKGETVFWYSTGELCNYPTGDLLVKVEGLEVTRSIVVERYKVHQLSRKVYLFRDKDTNDVLTEYQGGAVLPVTYKYQKMAYTLKGNVLITEAANGQGDQLAPLRGNVVSLRHLTNSSLLAFTCPVFVNVQTARGVYQSYENYDYFTDKTEDDFSNHCSMVRFGSTPPFAESAVMHMTGWRLDSFDLLPKSIQHYIQTENPTWIEAPLN